MRDNFAKSFRKCLEKYPGILITGDLGFGVFDELAKEFPESFINAGITEQSLTSMAAGLADEGFIPFVYSIANFPTFRNLEQIRNDIAYPRRHAIICSVGAGLAYGALGTSHFGVEDFSIIRSLPNMRILSPSDPLRAQLATESAFSVEVPTYLRLGKNGEEAFGLNQEFHTPVRTISHNRCEIAVISTGSVGRRVLEARKQLDFDFDHYSIEEIWPVSDVLLDLMSKYRGLLIVEEHSRVGGLYSIFSELKSDYNFETTLVSASVNRDQLNVAGSQDFLLDRSGLSARDIGIKIRELAG